MSLLQLIYTFWQLLALNACDNSVTVTYSYTYYVMRDVLPVQVSGHTTPVPRSQLTSYVS